MNPWNFLQVSFRFKQEFRWGRPVVGLYDGTGMLRFVGSSVEACLDYADLFEIPLSPCSLQMLPEPVVASIRVRGGRHLEGRSS